MTSLQIRADGMFDPDGKYPNVFTGLPATKTYKILAKNPDPNKKGWAELKAYQDRVEILKKIHSKQILLVSLPTGTGKTVIVPRLLFHYFGYEKKIIVTTPRKATTSGAGEFAAKCFDVPLFHLDENGKDIIDPAIPKGKENRFPTGYKFVGFKHGDSKEFADKSTRLLFTTDGTVKAIITGGDQDLSEYNGIVIDEVHERSVSIDIVIALVMDILNRRSDFKIIFMSATMDLNIFTDYFKKLGHANNYNIYKLEEEKTTFDIKHIKEQKPVVKNATKIIDEIYKKIDTIMMELDKSKEGGDILAFVSSDSETNKIKMKVNKNMSKYAEDNRPYAVTMSAATPESEQNIATGAGSLKNLNPTKDAPKGFARKIIIATPMAESSITFSDPLKYVIEAGFAYTLHYDADKYSYVVGKNYVPQSNIKQRCGRTGRTCAGTCIQLYTEKEYKEFPEFTVPEIRSEDFTMELLNIMKLPTNQLNLIKSLHFIKNMIEPIKNYSSFLKVGVENIKEMDFVDSNGNMNELGHICSDFGTFDIKIAKMIIGGFFLNCIEEVIMLCAILNVVDSFSDVFKSLTDEEKKDMNTKKKYEDAIKKTIKPEGDHLSLLIIYYKFTLNNYTQEYAEANWLNYKTLLKIQQSHIDLHNLIYKENVRTRFTMLDRFVNINQFKSYPAAEAFAAYNAYGGGKNDNAKTKSNYRLTKRNQKKEFTKNSTTTKHASRTYHKKYIQNNKSNSTLLHRYLKNGGGIIDRYGKDSPISGLSMNRYSNIYIDPTTNRYSDAPTPEFTKNINLNLNLSLNLKGGSSSTIDTKRRLKYMDLFTLSQFQLRNKSIKLPKTQTTEDKYNRIIAALYYGYSTNIGCYSGVAKDYYVKFSSIQGSIIGGMSKTSFDYIPPSPEPDWIIYKKFTVTQEFGKVEKKGNLSLVSKLEPKHLQFFFPLKEMMAQVMLEVK
jgi:pre-mRNA-splicing factor ATP-dependent RNA helicase DHX15/PRP43